MNASNFLIEAMVSEVLLIFGAFMQEVEIGKIGIVG